MSQWPVGLCRAAMLQGGVWSAALLLAAEGEQPPCDTQGGTNATFLWLIRVISSQSHTPWGAAGKLPHTRKLFHDTHTHTHTHTLCRYIYCCYTAGSWLRVLTVMSHYECRDNSNSSTNQMHRRCVFGEHRMIRSAASLIINLFISTDQDKHTQLECVEQ